MESEITLGIIDDEELTRDSVGKHIGSMPGMRLVATAATVREYLQQPLSAQIVLLDLNLKDYSEPAENVAKIRHSGAAVIVVSRHAERHHILSVIEAGAATYVLKGSTNMSELFSVIQDVAEGRSSMTAEEAFHLSRDDRAKRPRLSPREAEILRIYATGSTRSSIARRMGISESTVSTHLGRIKEKYAAVGRPIKSRTDYMLRHQEDKFNDDPPPEITR